MITPFGITCIYILHCPSRVLAARASVAGRRCSSSSWIVHLLSLSPRDDGFSSPGWIVPCNTSLLRRRASLRAVPVCFPFRVPDSLLGSTASWPSLALSPLRFTHPLLGRCAFIPVAMDSGGGEETKSVAPTECRPSPSDDGQQPAGEPADGLAGFQLASCIAALLLCMFVVSLDMVNSLSGAAEGVSLYGVD